jgi:hypothetical protein
MGKYKKFVKQMLEKGWTETEIVDWFKEFSNLKPKHVKNMVKEVKKGW